MQKTLSMQHKKTNMSKRFQENALNKMKSEELIQDMGNIRSNQNQSDRIGTTMKKLDKKGEKHAPMTMADNSMENSFVDNILIKNINS
jgi:hypothetical protein